MTSDGLGQHDACRFKILGCDEDVGQTEHRVVIVAVAKQERQIDFFRARRLAAIEKPTRLFERVLGIQFGLPGVTWAW